MSFDSARGRIERLPFVVKTAPAHPKQQFHAVCNRQCSCGQITEVGANTITFRLQVSRRKHEADEACWGRLYEKCIVHTKEGHNMKVPGLEVLKMPLPIAKLCAKVNVPASLLLQRLCTPKLKLDGPDRDNMDRTLGLCRDLIRVGVGTRQKRPRSASG